MNDINKFNDFLRDARYSCSRIGSERSTDPNVGETLQHLISAIEIVSEMANHIILLNEHDDIEYYDE